jgi:tRNA A-37 threonylcarbamoyl transferase component Bud32
LRQVNQALSLQKRMGGKDHRALGKILVSEGFLDEVLLMEALSELGTLTLFCEACRQNYAPGDFDREREYICPVCESRLVIGDPPDTLSSGAAEETPALPAPAVAPRSAPGLDPPTISGGAPRRAGSDRDPLINKVLGGCQLLERVAQGGMGVVYKARQLNLNRTVAVKVLSEELSRDAGFVRRFIEEARSAAQLNHGNIVHINDVGEYQGVFYFSMEYVDGRNLTTILKEVERLPVERSLEITLEVCKALKHAHGREIVHRDIKPENIMITRDGVVKLADLGLAKKLEPSPSDGLTRAGSILGTPFYMAPEQAKDFSRVDKRSDIYSLGVTLFRMITGKVPFDGRTPIEVMIKVIAGKRQRLSELREEVPPAVEAIVDRMISCEPEDRYQDVSEVIAEISQVLESLTASRAAR